MAEPVASPSSPPNEAAPPPPPSTPLVEINPEPAPVPEIVVISTEDGEPVATVLDVEPENDNEAKDEELPEVEEPSAPEAAAEEPTVPGVPEEPPDESPVIVTEPAQNPFDDPQYGEPIKADEAVEEDALEDSATASTPVAVVDPEPVKKSKPKLGKAPRRRARDAAREPLLKVLLGRERFQLLDKLKDAPSV